MKIVKNRIIPPRGFSYVNLFGVLFTRRDKKISDVSLNHEQIHTEKYFSDLANAEVEVSIEEVDEKELFKAAKDCGLKFADMETLDVVIG